MAVYKPGQELTIADNAYDGELAKQAVDADYYTNKAWHSFRKGNETHLGFCDAISSIAFAGAIAMSYVEQCETPGMLVEKVTPFVDTAQRHTQEALDGYGESLEPNHAPQLLAVQPFISAMIFYKPLCLYGDMPAAQALRQTQADEVKAHTVTTLRSMMKLQENPRYEKRATGIVHELSTMALLNENWSPRPLDSLTFPTFFADDMNRQADLVRSTPCTEVAGWDGTLQYIQAKNKKDSSNIRAWYQAKITGFDVGNCRGKDNHYATARILTSDRINSEEIAHLLHYQERVEQKVSAKSVRFPIYT